MLYVADVSWRFVLKRHLIWPDHLRENTRILLETREKPRGHSPLAPLKERTKWENHEMRSFLCNFFPNVPQSVINLWKLTPMMSRTRRFTSNGADVAETGYFLPVAPSGIVGFCISQEPDPTLLPSFDKRTPLTVGTKSRFWSFLCLHFSFTKPRRFFLSDTFWPTTDTHHLQSEHLLAQCSVRGSVPQEERLAARFGAVSFWGKTRKNGCSWSSDCKREG